MDEEPQPSSGILSQIRDLLGLAGEEPGRLARLSVDMLLRQTRRQLLEYARRLGLTGLHGLGKEALAKRFQQALQTLGTSAESPEAVERSVEEPADLTRKFDLGRPAEKGGELEHLPWSYGQDRVTAMVVDPERLYVYWEVTDEAIERARGGLGPGGPGAWLNLRVYDVTNRIFDGTNAHSYFDHRVERTDRQWFFVVGKPTSTAVVELGLKSHEGYFVRIARSSRAEFPRREPAPPGEVEWLTVRTTSGEFDPPVAGGSPPAPMRGQAWAPEPVRVWDIRLTHVGADGEWSLRDESFGAAREWTEGHALGWEGPIVRTTWEAGPFSLPLEPPTYVEERHGGNLTVHTTRGKTQVMYGPWQVIIRGLGARAERRILARWEMHRTWVASAGTLRNAQDTEVAPGGSERLGRGASERRWLAASELRLGGASEVYRIGASELRYLGASELRLLGASERRLGGASEQRFPGASERRLGGASEGALPLPPKR